MVSIRKLGVAMVIGVALIVVIAFQVNALVRTAYSNHCAGTRAGLIALALEDYHATHGSYPPAYVPGADGKPAHSWRVLLLPYVGGYDVYKRYDFNEPWDGPHNRLLADEMPDAYRCPAAEERGPHTNFVAVVGPETPWPGETPISREEIKNTSATILVVEVADSDINWMEPRDLTLAEASTGVNKNRRRGISSNHDGGAMCGLAGKAGFLPNDISPDLLRARLTVKGGELLTYEQDLGWVLKEKSAEREHEMERP